jgi:hypothetical protein
MGGILVQPEVSHIHCTWTEGNILLPELIEIIANKNACEVKMILMKKVIRRKLR